MYPAIQRLVSSASVRLGEAAVADVAAVMLVTSMRPAAVVLPRPVARPPVIAVRP